MTAGTCRVVPATGRGVAIDGSHVEVWPALSGRAYRAVQVPEAQRAASVRAINCAADAISPSWIGLMICA